MNYLVKEEASEAVLGIYDCLDDAIEDAESRPGKVLVVEDSEQELVLYDSMPGVSFKI